jgi:hypothetical protein
VQYALSPYIKQIRFVFKGLIVLEAVEKILHVSYEQRWLVGRGYDGHVIHIQSQIEVTGRYRHGIHT